MISKIFKQILLGLNTFVAIALFLSVLSTYIPAYNLSILSLFGLIFPYLIFANLVFVFIWAFLRHHHFFISTTSILIALPLIINTFQFIPKKKTDLNSNSFKVMSYNVRVFDLYNWSNNKITRNNMFSYIRQESPEIACFQEFFNSNDGYFPVHDSLITNQKFKNAHIFYNVSLSNGHEFGIATYSKFPIVFKKELLFEQSHNLAIISDIKINKDTVRVINCHLESVRFMEVDYHFIDSVAFLSEERRINGFKGVTERLLAAFKKRSKQTLVVIDEIDRSPYPVILCGDFNDTPYSYTYQTFNKKLNDSHIYHKFGVGGTYHRFFPPIRIDYILYSNALECHNFETRKKEFSDHYPIVGYYSLK